MSVMEKTAQHQHQDETLVNTTVYEVGFLLLPTIPMEQIQGVFGSIQSIIEKNKGVIIASDLSDVRALAYTMTKSVGGKNHKFDHAYFGWVKFDLLNGSIDSIKGSIDGLNEVLRTLVIKTVRDNTLIASKVSQKDESKEKSDGEEVSESKAPANEEDIDKSIDALVMS